MPNLSERQRRRVDEIKRNYAFLAVVSESHRHGYVQGFRRAMTTMYPDAETMVNEDKQAADLVLTVLALEELLT